jgi:hypothetical protein
MAPTERKRRRGRGQTAALVLAAVLVFAALGGVIYAVVAGGSSTSTAKPASGQAQSQQGTYSSGQPQHDLRGHKLLAPECTPLRGRRWDYPVGPPIHGLPPVHANISSDLYEVFAINYDCKEAKTWIRKLSLTKIPIKRSGNVTVLKGPPGYYCSAWPDTAGRAYAGGCQSQGGGGCEALPGPTAGQVYGKGRGCKVTGGKEAFGWNWNVANRRVVFAHDDKGVLHLIHISGSDTNVIFRYLNGKYQLEILNTSGIGYLNGFTWTPSPGWSVTSIKKATGASCSLTPAGKISCAGNVEPPKCLCSGDGGNVVIEFAAAPTTKTHGFLFGGSAAQFKITKMTPVPYLIPGTPSEAEKRNGI